MKAFIIKNCRYLLLVTVLAQIISCSKDYTDPSRATSDKVFSSVKGLTGVAVGLQRAYTAGRASALYTTITADGFITKQLNIINQGNTAEYQLYLGANSIDGTNTVMAGMWTVSNKIVYDADNVITNAANLTDKSYASGLIAYASIFKALSIGNMAMFWDHVPDGTGSQVKFITNTDGFNRAVTVLDNAITAVNANAISAAFLTNIPAGIDIPSTLHALKARYALFAGNYTLALTEANLVDLSKKSVFTFDALTLNPIFETATSTNNVYQPVDSAMGLPVGLQPNLSDKREPFYIAINPTIAPRFRIKGFDSAATSSIPVYLPGEMTLIKAEAYARAATPDLVNAMAQLNIIITKQPAADPFGVGAGLPPDGSAYTQAQLLDQIYRHRCIELYMSGLKLADMRRFARPNSERTRNLLPYPFVERDNNTNTPPDPSF